ncbi:MAG: ABC transporter permease [Acidaminococcaceae bacterium]|nr:ABC transporter permease [Acidaminococcaceae bacterium]
MWNRLWALLKKEFIQMWRDKMLLFILIWSFTVSPFVASNGMSMEISHHPYIVYDQSQSPGSRELLSRFREPYFRLLDVVYSNREVVEYLDSGKASMAIVIPPDFAKKISAGSPANFQVISDGTISLSATVAVMYVAQISGSYTLDLIEQRGLGTIAKQSIPYINIDNRIEYNPNMTNAWFSGLVDFISKITMVSLLLTAAAVVREKEYGTIEQLMVTPARSFEIFLSKIIPNIFLIVPLSLVGLVGVMKGFYGLPIAGSIFLFYLVLVLYIFVMSSLGIQIALLAKNLPQAIMMMMFLLMPMIFLSGTFTPMEAMKPWMRWTGLLIPMHYFVDFTFDVLLKGNSLYYVWPSILGLVVLGTALFISSSVIFYRQFSK